MRSVHFRRLLSVIAAQNIGFWFIFPGLQLTVAVRTDNDPLALGLLFFVTMLPILVFSLHAGELLDRRDRIHVLNAGQWLMLVTAIATSISVWWKDSPLWLILACATTIGVSFAIALPAQQALLINSVPASATASAVSLNAMVLNVARMLGPGVAVIFIAAVGIPGSILLYGLAGVVGLLLSTRLALPRFAQAREAHLTDVGIRAGIRHARQRPPTVAMLVIVAFASLFGMSFVTQTPVIAAQISPDPQTFLFLVSAGGFGSLVGIFLVANNVGRVARVSVAIAALAVLGAMVVGLGWSRSLMVSMIIAAVAGAMQFAVTTIANVVVQTKVDDAYRGRVSSIFNIAWGGLIPIGGLLLAGLVTVMGVGWALTTSGGVSLVAAGAVAAYVIRRPRDMSKSAFREHPPDLDR